MKSYIQIMCLCIACYGLMACNLEAQLSSILKENTTSTTSDCLKQFHQKIPPYLINTKLKRNNYTLCYQGFSVLYSGLSKTPLWVAEHLTPERLNTHLKRQDHFHEEERISLQHRALLTDYRGSGFDRGHMAPNADMYDTQSQYDSFTLTNMVPQHPKNNQNIWREIEEATRATVNQYQQDAYVITGPIFKGDKIKVIGNQMLVPTAVYKAVYYPKLRVASAYYTPNDDSQRYEILSICALEQLLGINLFPRMSQEMKREIYDLPKKANEIKKNKTLALKAIDQKSQCASPVTDTEIKWQQQQFKDRSVQKLSYRNAPTSEYTEPVNEMTTQEQLIQQIALQVIHFLNH